MARAHAAERLPRRCYHPLSIMEATNPGSAIHSVVVVFFFFPPEMETTDNLTAEGVRYWSRQDLSYMCVCVCVSPPTNLPVQFLIAVPQAFQSAERWVLCDSGLCGLSLQCGGARRAKWKKINKSGAERLPRVEGGMVSGGGRGQRLRAGRVII